MNSKYWSWGLIVAIILGLGGWFAGSRLAQKHNNQPQPQEQQQQEQVPTKNDVNKAAETGNVWQGTLKASDAPVRGSLMLVFDSESQSKPIYIKTSRDFSSLIGRKVTVTYEGTMQQFRLIDIRENE